VPQVGATAAIANGKMFAETVSDIAGTVASMTECDPGVLSEELPTTPLVDRDSPPRRARGLGVQSDVGELYSVEECS
jgi:hypothetical protein